MKTERFYHLKYLDPPYEMLKCIPIKAEKLALPLMLDVCEP